MLVGLEGGNEVGGSPDRPLPVARARPRRGHGQAPVRPRPVDGRRDVPDRPRRPGRDHDGRPAPDPRPGRAGRLLPRLRVLGTGFKTAPAIGPASPSSSSTAARRRSTSPATRWIGSPPAGCSSATTRTASSGADRPRARPRCAAIRILDVTDARRPSAGCRPAPTPASTTARATTGRTPTAARRRRACPGSSRRRRPARTPARPGHARRTRSSPISRRSAGGQPVRDRPPGEPVPDAGRRRR